MALPALGKMVRHALKAKLVSREDETALFIAPADHLEEEIGGAGIVGEIPDLIDLC